MTCCPIVKCRDFSQVDRVLQGTQTRTRSDSQVPGIQFGTVRFNDKPEARYKCSPGWERFTTRLDVAKLNMRLLSVSLESGTGSSNSLRSVHRFLHFLQNRPKSRARAFITEGNKGPTSFEPLDSIYHHTFSNIRKSFDTLQSHDKLSFETQGTRAQ